MITTDKGVHALSHLFDAITHTFDPKFDAPATRINFLEFPPEIRSKIIDYSLLGDLDSGTLEKAMHHDDFSNPCCVWNWPDQLIICDKEKESDLPNTMFPKWLPHLALTNHQMRGEVLVHMLKTTDCVTLKYDKDLPVKIAPWFSKFLATFPANEGFEAVRNLNFPHIHWYNYNDDGMTLAPNPDVELMLQCPNLERIGMTFHFKRIAFFHPYDEWNPMALNRFLSWWKLRPMLGCDNLKHVYIGGIMWHSGHMAQDGDPLQTLRDFGAWLRESFAEKKPEGQKVLVTLHPRYGAFRGGWDEGEPL
ncbi:hypothetical protein P171DRAFT_373288 [Karstenula rhodostoma CBS 690.94]|uniref:Uncharacterized protein n=1 Tax=Karstenula rhodostoma CBS 690.94 TaxID=1392251 RepID=A0A9P4P3E5_9PLEO|nr:hypothetical protein P171DRAFT_373288 [Karstenula rhodostoma CBS 690.94]